MTLEGNVTALELIIDNQNVTIKVLLESDISSLKHFIDEQDMLKGF